ncbi:glycerophosphodiester phosphodiesterase [Propionivibrio sp.]|uniref:glycerophosphodiester phosphodiesterase n=1 Tax=Propionivibrio sp. TaxID=2212460 RepID=UPI0025D36368|nr:glycerophosphodiester phosphodiesterase [Propionivibrio sp.]MBK7355276.1 glycerophosphodiester phosphodiesterase [Propionivibrio sp.]MBK8399671.1 glycerophosphodiester phosphodiesterase [Propionivibrio sp.]MBK8744964.1 glycerophosphodiester phosphodiesterase [Propionivibrio sp.]MBK8893563.1 glycerophosphodiester phosphodiesterase [Propionivibrio sp.]MBL0208651.1 glycerophosphodiester phosphodiesterase [Propionivibrio sp.]
MNRPAPGWTFPRVFAHRCGGALAPENTLSGLRIAAAMGCRAVEFDVMLSGDNTPWLIHDETLERTSDGIGPVCQTSDDALGRLDAGLRYHRAFTGEPLPTLAAAAALCLELGLMVNVEIKPAAGHEAVTGEIVATRITELWRGAPLPIASSFSEVALEAARQAASQLPLGYLSVKPPPDWLHRLNALGAYSLHCAVGELDDAVLDAAKANGVPVLCYTVNDRPAADALFKRGVAAVFSDRIEKFRTGT